MHTHNIDICTLSEIKKKRKRSVRYQNYILLYSEVERNNRAVTGVGILIH
jgi:hypothetical protein